MIERDSQVTPRESIEHQWHVDDFKSQSEHAITIKKLELELSRSEHQAEIDLKKLQAKWASWLQIPIIIIKLPVLILFAFAYICSMFTKKEMPKRFWDFLGL